MNPSSNETGLNLPPVAPEQSPVVTGAPEAGLLKNERPSIPAEKMPAAGQSVPSFSMPTPVQMPTTGQQSVVGVTSQDVVQSVSDDDDLIEKDWVNKAKAIVERTRDDPYKQSEELTVFKADYMKRRYDKTIKVSQ